MCFLVALNKTKKKEVSSVKINDEAQDARNLKLIYIQWLEKVTSWKEEPCETHEAF